MRGLLLIGTAIGCAIATAASAQSAPPPLYNNLDANGVDVVTGVFTSSLTEGSIGSGEGAVSVVRDYAPDQWSGRLYRRTVGGVSLMYAEFGATSDTFTIGSGYVSTKANGATLTVLGQGKFLYTASDGAQIEYESTVTEGPFLGPPNYVVDGPQCTLADAGTCAIPISITKPDGMAFTLNWTFVYKCGGTTLPCPDPKGYFRFAGVTSSAHYGFTIHYATNDPGNFNEPQTEWYDRTGETFTNTLSPPATLPTVTYAHPSTGVEEITDANGGVWRYTSSTDLRIRRPGSSTDNIVVTFGTGGTAASVTVDGVTYHYARTPLLGGAAKTTVTDPAGNATVYNVDPSRDRVTSVTDALGNVTSYAYDTNGRLTQITHPEGDKVVYAYDARGNVTSTSLKAKSGSGLADIVTSASYPSTCTNVKTCNSPTWTKDALGNQTDYSYGSDTGQPTSVTAPAPSTGAVRPQTRYGYALSGAVSLAGTISRCQTALSCAGTADEAVTTIAYNGNLLPSSVTQASGTGTLSAVTGVTYTPLGDIASIDGPLSGTSDTTTYRYDTARRVAGVISADPDGAGSLVRRAERLSYNSAGQVTEAEAGTVTGTTDAAWAAFATKQQVTTTYDANARKTRDVVSAAGASYAVTDYSYDTSGRLDCTAQRMNSAAWGTVTPACTAQALGSAGPDRISRTGYDQLSRVASVTTGYGISGTASTESTSYTVNGQIASVTDGETNKTSYLYDGFDRLSETEYPISAKGAGTSSTTDYEQLGYDADGNVTSRRLRDGTSIAYGYDYLNRLIAKNLPGSEPDVTYTYDNLGRPTGASQTGNALTFTYDALSRLLTETGPEGTLTSTWDAAGRRTELQWPDGFYVNYDYDVLGEMTAVRENGATSGVGVLASYTYDDLGDRTGATFGNGTSTSWTPDAMSRLSQLTHNLASTANDLTKTFSYNPAGQIASTTSNNDAYAWNGAANVDRNYTADGLNQYTASGSTSLGYDMRGNLTTSGSDSYTYSSENLLKTGPGSTSLSYDPLLRLYEVTQGSATARFGYDGLELVAEYGASNALTKRYVYGPGTEEPIAWYEGSGTTDRRWLHTDERGSVIAVTDDTGTVITGGINSYDEYGIPGATNIGRFQYTGQTWIPELGMYYYKARMYSPSLGRFMQTDPIGYGDGLNLYDYVGSDPVNFVDPLGLDKCGAGYHPVPTGKGGSPSDSNDITVTATFRCVKNLDLPNSGQTGSPSASVGGQDIVVTGRRPQNTNKPCSSPPISPAEAAAAARGDRQAFWSSRAARGDPLGETGLEIVNDTEFLGVEANDHLAYELERAGRGPSQVGPEIQHIGVELMRAQVNAVNIFGSPSPAQVAAYHFQVFNAHGLPDSTFGGAVVSGTETEATMTSHIWMHCQ